MQLIQLLLLAFSTGILGAPVETVVESSQAPISPHVDLLHRYSKAGEQREEHQDNGGNSDNHVDGIHERQIQIPPNLEWNPIFFMILNDADPMEETPTSEDDDNFSKSYNSNIDDPIFFIIGANDKTGSDNHKKHQAPAPCKIERQRKHKHYCLWDDSYDSVEQNLNGTIPDFLDDPVFLMVFSDEVDGEEQDEFQKEYPNLEDSIFFMVQPDEEEKGVVGEQGYRRAPAACKLERKRNRKHYCFW